MLLTGLNGDSYGGCGAPPIGPASNCDMFAGLGGGGTYSLSALQGGSVAGIGPDTPVALWVGITNGGNQRLSADIGSITVTTVSSVPEPGSVILFGSTVGLVGLIAARRKRS